MKKFISMVMAAAMVVSLVPATAFAATGEITADGAAKVIGAREEVEDFSDSSSALGYVDYAKAPEVQIELDDVFVETTGAKAGAYDFDVTYTLDGAEFATNATTSIEDYTDDEATAKAYFKGCVNFGSLTEGTDYVMTVESFDDTSVTLNFTNYVSGAVLAGSSLPAKGAKLVMNLQVLMDDTDAGSVATVSVESEIVGADAADMAFVEVKEEGIEVTLKKVADVAEEATTPLESKMEIEANVGTFVAGQTIELELSSGFEWVNAFGSITGGTIARDADDESVAIITVSGTPSKIVIPATAVTIDAVDAKAGDVATIDVEVNKNASNQGFEADATVEAAKVVGEVVTMTLDDEDEDVPVMYSGVNAAEDGLTSKESHKALKVKFEESVAEALDEKKAFTLTLTEGVYVTGLEVSGEKEVKFAGGVDATNDTLEDAFARAYDKGDHECFEFARKTFGDSAKPFEFVVEMELIAEPGFTGDVTLTLDGAGFEEAQEVVIANFVSPLVVEAQQNDVIIDYRNTEVPTDIVVKEAEAGLWAKNFGVYFGIDRFSSKDFEGDAVYTVNEESEMEVEYDDDVLGFYVDEKSDDEAAVVTISDISLYMGRNLAAGAYDLEMSVTAAKGFYESNLFTTEHSDVYCTSTCALNHSINGGAAAVYTVAELKDFDALYEGSTFTGWDIDAATAKEGFINIITAGRDQDDASFTKKVVVPVGESYIVAGEETVTLDVPAYVSAAGYTMLPVRAVAVALGINNNNVLWDQATKTVTILYGQRIITMTVGAKAINVNGSAIPASASPEVVDGRTFLPMRDLATALGVTDITWDAATKTATLNGNK